MLTPTQAWKDAANEGTAKPVLLFELRPTVLYAEKNYNGDWAGVLSNSNLDTAHDSNELRLAAANVVHSEKQTVAIESDKTFRHWRELEEGTSGVDRYSDIGQYIQTFSSATAFKLNKLHLGIYNHAARFKGKLIVRIFSHLNTEAFNSFGRWTQTVPFGSGSGEATKDIYRGAKLVHSIEYDCARDSLSGSDPNKPVQGTDYSGNFKIFDLTDSNVWIPGGNVLCAIDVRVDRDTDAHELRLCGSAINANPYTKGQLLHHDHFTGKSFKEPLDLAFKFEAAGYESSGSGIFAFDLGTVPDNQASGVIELKYCDPTGTALSFYYRESQSSYFTGSWLSCVDGQALTGKRYVQIKTVLEAGTENLDTPRVYSIRVAYRRSEKFVMAERRVLDYANLVSEAPDFSAEGDPLSGSPESTDTSRITLSDAGGMIPRLFELYPMVNDEIIISLGYDVDGFTEADYLPFKRAWVEDWAISDNEVVIVTTDQQKLFREAEAPKEAEKPEQTERINYVLEHPAQIKKDLLKRARIRPSMIGGSFTSLVSAKSGWQFTHTISEATKLAEIDDKINAHLLAIQSISEAGLWSVGWVDFNASPTVEIPEVDVARGSENMQFGRSKIKNESLVLFGLDGSGGKKDTESYRFIALDFDEDSQKQNKKYVADKLFSNFIPVTVDPNDSSGIALQIASARLNLQRYGYRKVSFSLPLRYAYLQIGDHISYNSRYYRRGGAGTVNPLLVFLTSKTISRRLDSVQFSAVVVADADEVAGSPSTVAPATGFAVANDGDGTVTFSWTASADDDGTDVLSYEIFRRLSGTNGWPTVPLETISATGAANYSHPDTHAHELVKYDYALRAVGVTGRRSSFATALGVAVTLTPLTAPPMSAVGISTREGEDWIWVKTDVANAQYYNVYLWYDSNLGWQLIGKIIAGTGEAGAISFKLPDTFGTIYGGGEYMYRLTAVDIHGQESEPNAGLGISWIPSQPALDVVAFSPYTAPTLPTEGGTYPKATEVLIDGRWVSSVQIKITIAAADVDSIDHIQIERRNDGGVGSWGDWNRLPEKKSRQNFRDAAGSTVVLYDNPDATLKPGYAYQYRARIVDSLGLSSPWSGSIEITLPGDSTPPAKPVLTVTAVPTANLVEIAGGTEEDFNYFKVEGSSNGGTDWSVLAAKHGSNLFVHDLTDSGMATSWRYRVTAYDTSGNASTVSTETADYTPEQVGSNTLKAGAVIAGKLAVGAVIAGVVAADALDGTEVKASANFTCGTGSDIIRISGDDATYRLWIGATSGGSAQFSVTKAGVVNMTKASIKTDPSANNRVEIASDYVKVYGGGVLGARLGILSGFNGFGFWEVTDSESSAPTAYPKWTGIGFCIWPEDGGQICIPNVSDVGGKEFNFYGGDGAPTIRWDDTANKLKIGTYTFTPD